jgi:2-methylfumaryl-CoA hydratase
MVKKKDPNSPAPTATVPDLPACVKVADLVLPEFLTGADYPVSFTGSGALWEHYAIGEKIDHRDGYTIEEAEHQMATRLYQNTARVHFNAHTEAHSRFAHRLIYGGHIISLVRSLSFNGLANGVQIVAINGGRHVAPTFAGDTIYGWSQILDKGVTGHPSLGVLRVRTVGVKNALAEDYPLTHEDGRMKSSVVLDLDYWVVMPRV